MAEFSTPQGKTCPLPEYPRPQLRRDSFLNLNGAWSYTVQDGEEYTRQNTGVIRVPYAPEAPLSGCDFRLQTGETLWYERTVVLPSDFRKDRVLLHFGAVDQSCQVRVNDRVAGRHEGGYLPFTLDITDFLTDGENQLTVGVNDLTDGSCHAFGRQKEVPGGMWHTAQSGIWQTVWMESVPENYVQRLELTPDFDKHTLVWKIHASNPAAHVAVWKDGECIAEGQSDADGCGSSLIRNEDFHPWTPEDPYLYTVTVDLEGGDRVESYFGMRKFSTMEWKGRRVLALNNQPYFHHGVLDEGYWPDGLYTAPSDEAMVQEIRQMKALGFNTVRKHVKIEPLRWYYHCDRLGMIVWQDLPSGFDAFRPRTMTLPWAKLPRKDSDYKAFGRSDSAGRRQFESDLAETVCHLYNSVSLGLWTLFHEGWGQFDALRLTEKLRTLDTTRLIDHASGWHDQGGGDLQSVHAVGRSVKLRHDGKRVLALTEMRGSGVENLYETQVLPYLRTQGLSAVIYAPWCDVEDEENGLVTDDRKTVKVDAATMQTMAAKLNFEM